VEEKFEEMGETGSVQQVQESLRLLSQKKKNAKTTTPPRKNLVCVRGLTCSINTHSNPQLNHCRFDLAAFGILADGEKSF